MTKTDQKDKAFWDALAHNNYKVSLDGKKGNPVAGRWQREYAHFTDEQVQEYEAMDKVSRADFRSRWFKAKHKNWLQSKGFTEAIEHTEYKNLQMLPIGRIAHLEGGGRERDIYVYIYRCIYRYVSICICIYLHISG